MLFKQKKCHRSTFIIFCGLFLTPIFPAKAILSLKEIALYSAGATVSSCFGYLYCSKPQEFIPTVENLQTISAMPLEYTDPTKTTLFESQSSVASIPSTAQTEAAELSSPSVAVQKPILITTPKRIYTLQQGIGACTLNNNEPVWIASCGWEPLTDYTQIRGINPNISQAKRYLDRHIFHGPSIFFVHNDNRRVFNFGQDTDQANIDFIYHQAADKNVIFHGLCRGATAILGWMQHYESSTNVRAIILESPAVSLKAACHDTGMCYGNSAITGVLTHALLSFYYPNYDSQKAEKQKEIEPLHIAKDVPIFIGNIKQDTVTSDKTVTTLVKELRKKSQNPIYYFICDDPTLVHAQLSKSKTYQQAVNAFLKKYNLPCDETLAEQGKELLENARLYAEKLKNS